MVAASAAFGNSFTLPAVFLTTLLPKALADRAVGYAALFLLAWSPCLWSIGMALMGSSAQQPVPRQQQQEQAAAAAAAQQLEQQGQGAADSQQPKPLPWRQPRVVDITPAKPGRSGSSGSSSPGGSSSSGGQEEEAEALVEPPSWAESLAQHPAVTRVLQFGAQVGG